MPAAGAKRNPRASVAAAARQQKPEEVVSCGRFDHAFADAHPTSVGQLPVHPGDVVAIWAVSRGGRGKRAGRNLLAEWGCPVQEQREPQPVRRGLAFDRRRVARSGQAENAVHRIHEMLEKPFLGAHAANRLSVKTFMGLN